MLFGLGLPKNCLAVILETESLTHLPKTSFNLQMKCDINAKDI